MLMVFLVNISIITLVVRRLPVHIVVVTAYFHLKHFIKKAFHFGP